MERLTKKCEDNYELYVKLPTLEKQKFIDRLGKLEDLEEELGCPLDVRCAVIYDTKIYDEDGNEYTEIEIFKDYFLGYNYKDNNGFIIEPTKFYWKDYGTEWFLENPRKDKSE